MMEKSGSEESWENANGNSKQLYCRSSSFMTRGLKSGSKAGASCVDIPETLGARLNIKQNTTLTQTHT